jgi:hypothetical protein
MDPVGGFAEHGPFQQFAAHNKRYSADQEGYPHQTRNELGTNGVKPPRGKPRGILKRMAELSIAISPPSLKLRRALLAIHPRGKPRGILAKESKAFQHTPLFSPRGRDKWMGTAGLRLKVQCAPKPL